MSHLSTIIDRVKRRAEAKDFENSMFEQAVINLMEYIQAWTDYNKEEFDEAIKLYDEFRPKFKGKLLPSHKERLKEADQIRNSKIVYSRIIK